MSYQERDRAIRYRKNITSISIDAATVEQYADAAVDTWRRYASEGFPPVGGDGGRSSRAVPDPTGRLATETGLDPIETERRGIEDDVEHAMQLLRSAAAKILALVTIAPHEPDRSVNGLKCANVNGCPDDAFSDVGFYEQARCHTCAQYLTVKGRDRRRR